MRDLLAKRPFRRQLLRLPRRGARAAVRGLRRRAAAPRRRALPALRARLARRRGLRPLPARSRPRYDATIAALAYDFPADALVHALKFRGELALAPLLASLLSASMRELRAWTA